MFGLLRRLGAGALPFPGRAHRRRAGRPAVRAADGGRRHRADRALRRRTAGSASSLEPLGIKVAFTPLGIVVALIFIGLPFVVRTVQPVLEDLDREVEEAAATLGATRAADVLRASILPTLLPALLTGFALAFARAVGEYGSVIFIAGNMPMVSEIAPLLIVIKLEQYDYAGATAIAVVMLVVSFVLLLVDQPAAGAGAARDRRALDAAPSTRSAARPPRAASRRARAAGVRWLLIGVALAFLALFLVLPLVVGLRRGVRARASAPISQRSPSPTRCAAIRLTLLVAAIAVPLNLVFGVAAAWAIAKFDFRGKSLLITLIDLPFSVSPVIAGLIYVLLFGAQGWFGPWLRGARHQDHLRRARHRARDDLRHLPVRRARADPADAGAGHATRRRRRASLGAGGWQIFWRVTLPNIKWGAALRRASSATRARWASSARSRSSPATSAALTNTHAAARRDPLQRVQLRGRVRGRLAARAAGARHAGAEDRRRVARRRAAPRATHGGRR